MERNIKGLFITLEGPEGSGKSTAMNAITNFFQFNNLPFLRTREPGGSSFGSTIRDILLDPMQTLTPEAELFLFLADRAQHVDHTIRPAIDDGVSVICDRYYDSTIAYQGYGRGLSVEYLRELNHMATKNFVPDLTLLLDLPVEEGLRRASARNAQIENCTETRFDNEILEFHKKVRSGFLEMAAQEERFCIIDAMQSKEDVNTECIVACGRQLIARGLTEWELCKK